VVGKHITKLKTLKQEDSYTTHKYSIHIYEVSPKRNRTFEIARQWAGAGCLRRWCCV